MDLLLVMPRRAVVFADPGRQVVHWGAFTWEVGGRRKDPP